MVNGEIYSYLNVILETWSNHFKTLSNSHSAQFLSMAEIQQDYDILYERSSEGVITSLKPDKAGGLDYLHTSQVEHLKYGSNSLMLGIQQVCNAIVELEVIPNVLKMGLWFQFTRVMKETK